MTESRDTGWSQIAENLTLRPQIPMVVPKEIRQLELAGQLPKGDIAYFDAVEPDTLRLVDRETWKPVMKKGTEARFQVSGIKHRFAGIILYVPERTPDNSYDERVETLSKILKRTATREEEIITSQNLGALFIVEKKGQDQRIGWRQDQLAKAGLVVDKNHDGSVIVTGDFIISYARRPMQRSAIDLTRGEKSQFMFPPFIDKIKRDAEHEGFDADTSVLEEESRATKNPPKTLGNLRDGGGGVIYEAMDLDGKRIVVDRTGNSETVTPSRAALDNLGQKDGREKPKGIELKHKGGDIEKLEARCGDCGGHFERRYFEIPGDFRSLLFSETVCPDHPGGTAIIERRHYEGPLGMLPPSMRKNSPPRTVNHGKTGGNGRKT